MKKVTCTLALLSLTLAQQGVIPEIGFPIPPKEEQDQPGIPGWNPAWGHGPVVPPGGFPSAGHKNEDGEFHILPVPQPKQEWPLHGGLGPVVPPQGLPPVEPRNKDGEFHTLPVPQPKQEWPLHGGLGPVVPTQGLPPVEPRRHLRGEGNNQGGIPGWPKHAGHGPVVTPELEKEIENEEKPKHHNNFPKNWFPEVGFPIPPKEEGENNGGIPGWNPRAGHGPVVPHHNKDGEFHILPVPQPKQEWPLHGGLGPVVPPQGLPAVEPRNKDGEFHILPVPQPKQEWPLHGGLGPVVPSQGLPPVEPRTHGIPGWSKHAGHGPVITPEMEKQIEENERLHEETQ